MPKTTYVNFGKTNELQKNIMIFIAMWVKENKTPVPKKVILSQMQEEGINVFTTDNALNALLRKGFIRRTYAMSNTTNYVQLKSI